MGSADLVPGISGATIALILNVYQPFIHSIKKLLSIGSLKLLLKGHLRQWFHYIRLEFILPLVTGIFTCIFLFASLIAFLLDNHPISFWSFFFGLILASALALPNYSRRFHADKIFLLIMGIVSGYFLISLNILDTPDTVPMFFLSGIIAIGAMLLPGVSGSFLLVVIGKYNLLIHAIKDIELEFLLFFSLGALVSLISLPRIIDFIFKKGKEWFIVFIAGFLIGSLKKIWPWKLTEPVTDNEVAISPFYYQKILNQDPQLLSAVFFALLGICIIFLICYIEKKFNQIHIVNNNK